MPKPILSIGIIFKNEIRCLERCLKSLAPLREALSCQLVMADTGSTDGSREIAEHYADILFDFPWIDDFSAARNAVLDRCSGKWMLSVDCDEYLQPDISELVCFLNRSSRNPCDGAYIVQRNYHTKEMDEAYSDFWAGRLINMSIGARWSGTIHEILRRPGGKAINWCLLSKTILDHDGYIGLNEEAGREKRRRNQALLEAQLAQNPEDIRCLLQCIECSRPDPQHIEYIRRGMAATEAKRLGWALFGPPIFRYAVIFAYTQDLPELEEWIARAEELFPDSFFTAIDVAHVAFDHYWKKREYADAVRWGERYLKAIADYEAGQGDQTALRASSLICTTPNWKRKVYAGLAGAYGQEGRPGRALEIMDEIEPLDGGLVAEALKDLWELQVSTDQDTAPAMLRLYSRIAGEQDEKRAQELTDAFLRTAPRAFGPDVREREAAREDFHRHSYTVFLPLSGRCEAGTAAAVLEAESVREIDGLLAQVKKWGDFSVSALIYALEKGAALPPAGGDLRLEEMDRLAERLTQYGDRFFSVVCQTAPRQCSGSWQQLLWARSMVFATVRAFDWTDGEQGLALARAFTETVENFTSRCYTPEALCEENLRILPAAYQYGWYSSRAFQALDSGDTAGYVRLLREGLAVCESAKPMAEFLLRHTPQLQEPKPSAELLALAERVRTLLLAYAPDDPAVAALKSSPAYQKVAHLIEGVDGGGLPS